MSQLAVQHSPAVRAAQKRLEATEATLRGAGATFAPRAEIAPGVGFTNANALLSRQIDIGGLRSANRTRAEGERDAARAALLAERLSAVTVARIAYVDLIRARQNEASQAELARLTEELKNAVLRRVEIGEAPAVQGTRAEIEVARAQQEVIRARADTRARLAILNRLLGRQREQRLVPAESFLLPDAPPAIEQLVETALKNRPEIVVALARIAARRGDVAVARAETRPTLYADVTTDAWSIDRYTASRRTSAGNVPLFGAQVRFNFPLGRDGAKQAEIARARAAVEEQEAEVEAVRRAITMEIEKSAAELAAARIIALGYQETILPQADTLARATRAGYDKGISNFLEVLDALRVQRQTRLEYQNALYDAARSRITLDTALGTLPKEVQP